MKILSILSISIIALIYLLCSCSQDKEITVTIENKSNITYDSIKLHFYSIKDTTFYKVSPKAKIVKKITLRNFNYPKNEELVSILFAFKDDYYYSMENGLIDYPYALLEDEYHYYIFDNAVSCRKELSKNFIVRKYDISEYKKNHN